MRPASRTALASLRRPRGPFVCDTCLSRRIEHDRRLFSASTFRPSATAPTASSFSSSAGTLEHPLRAGIAALTSRRLISISGPDAAGFLQGVITSNITTPRADRGFYTAFLNAQGRLLYDVFIYPDTAGLGGGSSAATGESFLIEVDAAEAERLTKHIRRYKLRAKFGIRLLDEGESTVWHAWNDGLAGEGTAVDGSSALLGSIRGGPDTDIITMQDTRVPNLGHRILARGGNTSLAELAGLDEAPEQAYQLRRYLNGVAEGQDELVREHALPQESNIELMGGVDFHKGCYVGQELTIRTRHRGVVRKRVLPCVLYDEAQAPPAHLAYRPAISGDVEGGGGSSSSSAGGSGPLSTAEMIPRDASIGRAAKKGRSAGKWLRGVGNVGLALCRLEIMTDIVLPGETAASTFRPDEDEFVLQQAEAAEDRDGAFRVKIKAFVPPWLRQGLDAEAAAAAQH